jgi:hypothetical protein
LEEDALTTRKQHIAEMRYALTHNCTLFQAKRRLARLREMEAAEFLNNLDRCGTRIRSESRDMREGAENQVTADQPWMMRE